MIPARLQARLARHAALYRGDAQPTDFDRLARLARLKDALRRFAEPKVAGFDPEPYLFPNERDRIISFGMKPKKPKEGQLPTTPPGVAYRDMAGAALRDKPGTLPTLAETKAMASLGEPSKGGYADAHKTVEHLLKSPLDAARWVTANAILSGQTGWEAHTAGATEALAAWHQAGRPTDERGLDDVFGTTGRSENGAKIITRRGTFKGPHTLQGSKVEYLKRMFAQGDDLEGVQWANIGNGTESFKTPNFGLAFVHPNGVPIDAHMAKLTVPGKPWGLAAVHKFAAEAKAPKSATQTLLDAQKELAFDTPHAVMAYKVLVAKAAHDLGWEPREVQEAVWTATLAAMTAKHVGATDAASVLKTLNNRAIKAGWSLNTVLVRPEVMRDFERLGVPAARVKKAIAASEKRAEAVRPGPGRTSDPAALETVLARLPSELPTGAKPIFDRLTRRQRLRVALRKLSCGHPHRLDRGDEAYNEEFRKQAKAAHAKMTPEQQAANAEPLSRFLGLDHMAHVRQAASRNRLDPHDLAVRVLYGSDHQEGSSLFRDHDPHRTPLDKRFFAFTSSSALGLDRPGHALSLEGVAGRSGVAAGDLSLRAKPTAGSTVAVPGRSKTHQWRKANALKPEAEQSKLLHDTIVRSAGKGINPESIRTYLGLPAAHTRKLLEQLEADGKIVRRIRIENPEQRGRHEVVRYYGAAHDPGHLDARADRLKQVRTLLDQGKGRAEIAEAIGVPNLATVSGIMARARKLSRLRSALRRLAAEPGENPPPPSAPRPRRGSGLIGGLIAAANAAAARIDARNAAEAARNATPQARAVAKPVEGEMPVGGGVPIIPVVGGNLPTAARIPTAPPVANQIAARPAAPPKPADPLMVPYHVTFRHKQGGTGARVVFSAHGPEAVRAHVKVSGHFPTHVREATAEDLANHPGATDLNKTKLARGGKVVRKSMDDHDAFIQAIAANPDDSIISGVFADHLEEQGHHHTAAVIRHHEADTEFGTGTYSPHTVEYAGSDAHMAARDYPYQLYATSHHSFRTGLVSVDLNFAHPVKGSHKPREVFWRADLPFEEASQLLHGMGEEGVREAGRLYSQLNGLDQDDEPRPAPERFARDQEHGTAYRVYYVPKGTRKLRAVTVRTRGSAEEAGTWATNQGHEVFHVVPVQGDGQAEGPARESREDIYSWLDHKGEFHDAEPAHQDSARRHGFHDIEDAFKSGWMRVTHYGRMLYSHNPHSAPNSRQKSALIDAAIENGMTHVLHDNEDEDRMLWSADEQLSREGQGDTPVREQREHLHSWLDPHGNFHPVVGTHDRSIRDHGFSDRDDAYMSGWQAVTHFGDELWTRSSSAVPNDTQMGALRELALKHGMTSHSHDNENGSTHTLWSADDRLDRGEAEEETPVRESAYRAPAGGVIVRGMFYQGGKMIPDLAKFSRDAEGSDHGVRKIPIEDVLPDQDNLETAVHSIHQGRPSEDDSPLEMYSHPSGKFILADGHHRLMQAILKGEAFVKGVVKDPGKELSTDGTVPLDFYADDDYYGLSETLKNGWLLNRLSGKRRFSRAFGPKRLSHDEPPAPKPHKTQTPEFKAWFGDWENEPHAASKVVDETGRPKVVYHGAKRTDRIGSTLIKGRSTSGPMPYFTDDPEIASSYATGKADNSLEHPPYEQQFVIRPDKRSRPIPIDKAWHYLPHEERQRIAALAPRVGNDDDGNLALHPEGHTTATGGYDYHIQEARGNHLRAMVEEWLNSGNLFNSEHEFLDVLKLAGMTTPVEHHDPHADRAGVLPAYLSIKNPLVTTAVPPEVVSALESAAKRRRPRATGGADFWDKNTRDPAEWVSQLKEDVAAGNNSMVWTSIPDWATATLEKMGYDGIADTGGKLGGTGHAVYVPFNPGQVKSSIANSGAYNPKAKKITKQRSFHAAFAAR